MRRYSMNGCASVAFGIALLLTVSAAGAARVVPLADAVKAGDVKTVRALLQQHVDVNAPEPDGTTALHWAAHQGDPAMVDLLIQAGARAAAANRYGVTPVSLAAESGNAGVVDRLLKAGANANATVTGGETALMTAARAGRTEAVRVLLEHKADVNAREATRGQTALMWAAAEGHADVIRVLLQGGADLKAISRAPTSDPKITDGDSIYKRVAPRVDKFTPLQFAVQAGHIEAVRTLLEAGANILDETPQGMSTLILAIANAHFELAALLVEKGADVNNSKLGFTALHQLVRMRTLNIGQFPHPVATGAISGVDLAQTLLKRGAAVDARTTKGFSDGWRGGIGSRATAFLLAAKGGDTDMMRLLVANGADPLAKNGGGTTAIMVAAGIEMFNPNEDSGTNEDGLAAAQLAVELGGDVNEVNNNGEAPLHGAVHRSANAIIQFLVDKGAKVDVKTKRGLTPLQIANGEDNFIGMVGKRPDVIALLTEMMLARGLKPEMKTDDEATFGFGVKVK